MLLTYKDLVASPVLRDVVVELHILIVGDVCQTAAGYRLFVLDWSSSRVGVLGYLELNIIKTKTENSQIVLMPKMFLLKDVLTTKSLSSTHILQEGQMRNILELGSRETQDNNLIQLKPNNSVISVFWVCLFFDECCAPRVPSLLVGSHPRLCVLVTPRLPPVIRDIAE